MHFLPFVSLFSALATATPLEQNSFARHPSIDTLNAFAVEVGNVAEEFARWGGNPSEVERLLRHSRDAIGKLHVAIRQIDDGGDIDYLSSGLGFASAGLSISSKAHTFASAITGKLPLFKQVKMEHPVFVMLDQAYTETTAFFTAAKKKMPTIVYTLLQRFHNEILGTLSNAREAFRPSQEIVVVVVEGSSITFGATQTHPATQYQPGPQYTTWGPSPQPTQWTPKPQQTQWNPNPQPPQWGPNPQQTPWNQFAPQPEPRYTQYTQRGNQANAPPQMTPYGPTFGSFYSYTPLATTLPGTAYAW